MYDEQSDPRQQVQVSIMHFTQPKKTTMSTPTPVSIEVESQNQDKMRAILLPM
jgi:hypothetical protein